MNINTRVLNGNPHTRTGRSEIDTGKTRLTRPTGNTQHFSLWKVVKLSAMAVFTLVANIPMSNAALVTHNNVRNRSAGHLPLSGMGSSRFDGSEPDPFLSEQLKDLNLPYTPPPVDESSEWINLPDLANLFKLEDKSIQSDFMSLPLADAGEIRSFTPEQQKDNMLEASYQLKKLQQQCQNLEDGANWFHGNVNGVVVKTESNTRGWIALPEMHKQPYFYQLFSADPLSPMAARLANGHRIPNPDFFHQFMTIMDRATENTAEAFTPLEVEVAKNSIADELPNASAGLTFAPPKIQKQLDSLVLSTEVGNSTVLVLKPCNAITGQLAASVLVLSAYYEAQSVTMNIGTEGMVVTDQPANRVRIAHDCQTVKPGILEGRLQMFDDGRWTNICSDNFFPHELHVACRQLTGNSDTGTLSNLGYQPPCRSAIVSAVDKNLVLSCTGNEINLQACDIKDHYGCYNGPVTVRCSLFKLSPNHCDTEANANTGTMIVRSNGIWGSVCSNGVSVGDGENICKSLGYPGGVIKRSQSCSPADVTGPIHMAGLHCNGNETSPHECSYNEQTNNCDHNNDLVLSCGPLVRFAPTWHIVEPGSVKGILEVFSDNQWSNVCKYDFDASDARVACNQLGYSVAAGKPKVVVDSSWPESTIRSEFPFQIAGLDCSGNEKSLLDCPQSGLGISVHCRAAIVRCPIPTPQTPEPGAIPQTPGFRATQQNASKAEWSSLHFVVSGGALTLIVTKVCNKLRKAIHVQDLHCPSLQDCKHLIKKVQWWRSPTSNEQQHPLLLADV